MAERAAEVVSAGPDGLRLRLLGPACAGCGGCGGRCGLFGGDAAGEVRLDDAAGWRIGQHVRLELDDAALRAAAWRGYGIALAGLLAGAAAGRAVGAAWPIHADLLTFAGLASGTFLAAAFSKRRDVAPTLHAADETPLPPTDREPRHP